MVVQRGFNRCGVKSFCPWQCSNLIHHTSVKMVSVVLLAQQFYTGLKQSRSPCTISECLTCRVCNSSYHHIYTWSTMCVSERMQNSPLPFQAKQQHHWSRTTATNLGCMKARFGLICLNFLWNCLRDITGHSGWFSTLHPSLSWDMEEAQPFFTFMGISP